MKQLRVAMLAPPWLAIPPKGYGGVENVLDALVRELLHLGVKVELFTVGETTLRSTKKHWLYKQSQMIHMYKPWFDSIPVMTAHVLFALNAIKKDGGFDIIHDHNVISGPLALAFADSALPPAIHTLHGPPFTDERRLKESGLPDNMAMWRQFGSAAQLYFVAISEALHKNAPRALKKRMLAPVHNPIKMRSFPFVKKKGDYFATLARFHPDKGQALAVRACKELGYYLKMAGSVAGIASRRQVLMELANPSSAYRSLADFRYFSDQIFPHIDGDIEHIGEVQGREKMRFISRARALLFPIQWDEPFGMAATEALACGTPVVAMNRGALPEIIEHGVNGFLANNYKEFKQYMQRVDEIDPGDCRRSVTDKFSATRIAQQYLERYHEVLARAKQARA